MASASSVEAYELPTRVRYGAFKAFVGYLPHPNDTNQKAENLLRSNIHARLIVCAPSSR